MVSDVFAKDLSRYIRRSGVQVSVVDDDWDKNRAPAKYRY